MYKKLREIFNWFQMKAIRRMNVRNVINEYYYRMDSSGTTLSGAAYKRQAVVYREKTIDDWIMSVTSATDPDDPRRGLLYRFYQSYITMSIYKRQSTIVCYQYNRRNSTLSMTMIMRTRKRRSC